jgi:hypothetical protein
MNTNEGKLVNSNGSDNMGADIYSDVLDCSQRDLVSLHIHASGAGPGTDDHVGVVYIQVSNDGSNWVNLRFTLDGAAATSLTVSSETELNALVNLVDVGWRWLRVFYDRTSGTGEFNVTEFHQKRGGR